MCGIAGKVSGRGPVDRDLIEAMCDAQVHRGPDSRGAHIGAGVGLGIQRLRVIDLATGDQPIYNEDRSIAVVLNGEIYNFVELREELRRRGHEFSTRGDTEVIVHLYEEFGPGAVERLQGMFAFALWDESKRLLLAARDRVGKKPFFYSERDGECSFASELAALLADQGVPRDLDPTALDQYLALGYVPAPASIWKGVRKLLPAHRLTWTAADGVSIERYWRLDYSRKLDAELPELEGELRTRVAAAVRRRLIADVPLGAFLSGGIDSSIVVAEMAAQSSEPVKTFSIGFEHERYDELPRARTIAERYGTEHTEFVVEPGSLDLLPALARHYGEPYADSSAIPTFQLAELTSAHVTVALNGDGGDESFAGYLRHAANARTAWLDSIPSGARERIGALLHPLLDSDDRRSRRSYAQRYLKALGADAPDRYAEHVGIFSPAERRALLDPEVEALVDHERSAAAVRAPWSTATGKDPIDRILQVDVESYLPGDLLAKVDVATMAYSLEARSPLLDTELMEFAAALPARCKLHGGQKKWLLRRAYRDRLPRSILDGPKRGFGVPLGEWLRGDRADWAAEKLLGSGASPLVRRSAVEGLLDAHRAGAADHSAKLWALLCLREWEQLEI